MTHSDITRALRRFWPLAIGVFAVFLVIGAAASFLPAKRYKASALLFAQPTNAKVLEDGANVIALVLPTIVEQAKTQQFKNQVSRATPDAADASLTASDVAGTEVLTITAESTDPRIAAVAANAAANQLRLKPITSTITLSVLNPAFVPASPSSPRKKEILLGCIVLGLIFALFAALAADAWRKRVTGAEAVRENFGLTVLGEISGSRRVRRPPAELFGKDGWSEVAEEYQRLRTNFDLLAGDYRTVAITSWAQGEGKTTVTANLGWTLASLGREVTLVDLDLRRPSMHTPFGLDVADGIGDLVLDSSRRRSPRGRPKQTGLPGLEVLTAGAPVDQPARAIETVFPQITQELETRLTLIDTPPLLAAETALIASMVDGLVIVIDVRRREPAELEAVLQMLKFTHTKILGVVLNRVRRSARVHQTSGYSYALSRKTGPGLRLR